MVKRPDYIFIKSKIRKNGSLELAASFSLNEGREKSQLELDTKDESLFLSGAEHVLSEDYGLYRKLNHKEFDHNRLDSEMNAHEHDLAYVDDKTGVAYRTTIYTCVTRLKKGK